MARQYKTCHELFNALVYDTKSTGDHLKNEAAALQETLTATRGEVRSAIDILAPELNPELLACFDAIADKTGANRDFTLMVKNMTDEDQVRTDAINTLKKNWTDPAPLREALNQATQKFSPLLETIASLAKPVYDIKRERIPVDAHNIMYRKQLDETTANGFREFSRAKYFASRVYRNGYDVLKNYKPLHGSFENDIAKLAELQEELDQSVIARNVQGALIDDLQQQIADMDRIHSEFTAIEEKLYGPEDILNTVRGTLANLCLENRDFAKALIAEAGDHGIKLAETINNIEGLETTAHLLNTHHDCMLERAESLEKLRLGFYGSAKPSTELDNFINPVNTQIHLAREALDNATTLRKNAITPPLPSVSL